MKIDIGYEFKDTRLLVRALTHRSADHCNNETLEFFGDSVLDLYAASRLMALMPDARENTLASKREQFTCEKALHTAALRAGLKDAMILGKSLPEPSPRLLASAMEAVIAAAYIDGGFPAVRAIDEKIGLVRL